MVVVEHPIKNCSAWNKHERERKKKKKQTRTITLKIKLVQRFSSVEREGRKGRVHQRSAISIKNSIPTDKESAADRRETSTTRIICKQTIHSRAGISWDAWPESSIRFNLYGISSPPFSSSLPACQVRTNLHLTTERKRKKTKINFIRTWLWKP